MSEQSLDDLARRLEQLPREAWDRPEPPPAPWPAEERPARRRGFLLRPVAAVAASVVLLAAGVAGGLLLGGGEDDGDAPAGVKVALGPVDGRGAGATGEVSLEGAGGGTADVRVTGLKPSDAGSFYELWLIGDEGELVSLGLLQGAPLRRGRAERAAARRPRALPLRRRLPRAGRRRPLTFEDLGAARAHCLGIVVAARVIAPPAVAPRQLPCGGSSSLNGRRTITCASLLSSLDS